MADAHAADQVVHPLLGEHITRHAVALALVEPALGATGDDAGGVLAPVLQEHRPLEQLGGDVAVVFRR